MLAAWRRNFVCSFSSRRKRDRCAGRHRFARVEEQVYVWVQLVTDFVRSVFYTYDTGRRGDHVASSVPELGGYSRRNAIRETREWGGVSTSASTARDAIVRCTLLFAIKQVGNGVATINCQGFGTQWVQSGGICCSLSTTTSHAAAQGRLASHAAVGQR